jgi:hypothetical protein
MLCKTVRRVQNGHPGHKEFFIYAFTEPFDNTGIHSFSMKSNSEKCFILAYVNDAASVGISDR